LTKKRTYHPKIALYRWPVLLWCCLSLVFVRAQSSSYDLKVFTLSDGLSHRDVFKIVQDNSGFIWMGTMNGLNRFDGYQFIRFDSRSEGFQLPFDAISDLAIGRNNELLLAGRDHLGILQTDYHQLQTVKINPQNLLAREARIPYNLFQDTQGNIWMAVFDEKKSTSLLQRQEVDGKIRTLAELKGSYPRRPLIQYKGYICCGAQDNELWLLSVQEGQVKRKISIPTFAGRKSRVVQFQATAERLWVFMSDGRLFALENPDEALVAHPVNRVLPPGQQFNAFLAENDGNFWVCGVGQLLHYNSNTRELVDYNQKVRILIKSLPNYRQIYRDQTGVIWVASDYGVVKMVESDQLFTGYLTDGNENCGNRLCSIRGMAEDEDGKIYISYYSSVHVLDPRSNSMQLLFPDEHFFFYPFGLLCHQGKLYTGSGLQIDLKTRKIRRLLKNTDEDLGVVCLDKQGNIWFGFDHRLVRFSPKTNQLQAFRDQFGAWSKYRGQISYLHPSRDGQHLWVGTNDNGLYKINLKKGAPTHWQTGNSLLTLPNARVTSIYEDKNGWLWVGTAGGLQKIRVVQPQYHQVFTSKEGLSNDFVNGIVPEGDSCFWISTDYGLNRLSTSTQRIEKYYESDGLAHNEFNRMAYLRARDGRLYFGGLNGVNAFYPGPKLWKREKKTYQVPVLLTNFTHYDGTADSIIAQNVGLNRQRAVSLTHRDRYFSLSFAQANYDEPNHNLFSYMLEGYDEKWSPLSPENTVRYNNIPEGHYQFLVRGYHEGVSDKPSELAVDVYIEQPFYKSPRFIFIALLLGILGVYGFLRYRIWTIRRTERTLEGLVKSRTRELEDEKHKSEQLLLNILPEETAEELKQKGKAGAKRYENVTVMFSDFQGFSLIAEQMDPEKLVEEIDFCFRAFDGIIDRYDLEKIKTIGDAYMCMDNGTQGPDGAERVVKAALEIQIFLAKTAQERSLIRGTYFKARIGIHSGPVVAGVVGAKKFAYDIWGDTVNVASRMESFGEVGKVNVSKDTLVMLNGEFKHEQHGSFTDRDSDVIEMFFVEMAKESQK
jgi:class 3 adenylate cyclase/ligand-binding sensor domain-containing protein